jgi:hypothetical protein
MRINTYLVHLLGLSEISFLQCFTDVEVSEMCMERWRNRYQEYLWETRSLFLLDFKEGKNMKLQQVHAKYKQVII